LVAFRRGSPEDKEQRERERALQKRNAAIEQMRSAFYASPAGQAREAFEAGDRVFQCVFDVYGTQTVTVPMVGSYSAPKATNDPTDILNSVCHEGWELVNGSFVFVQTGSESRDKFLASGQHIAVSGTVLGYYLFKRHEANKSETVDPWEADLIRIQP
jgi:hypothetical protein